MPEGTILERLRHAVLQHEVSVNKLARTAGVPQQVLQRFAAGTRKNIRTDTATKLMSVLGFVMVEPQPIKLLLQHIDSQLLRWEGIRQNHREAFPSELSQMIDEFRELHRLVSATISESVL
jgi:hypothetical protein